MQYRLILLPLLGISCFLALLALKPTIFAQEDHPIPSVEWLGNGEIAVDSEWILDPSSGKFKATMACPPRSTCAKAPSGNLRAALQDSITVKAGPMDSEVAALTDIPLWVTIPEDADEPDKYELINIETAMAWVGNETLFVNQRNRDTAEVKCRTLDANSGTWSDFEDHCIEPTGSSLASIDSGPNGLLAVYSSSEGTPFVQIYRRDPETGLADLELHAMNLYQGSLRVHFLKDAKQIALSSPCDLTTGGDTQPCGAATEKPASSLYSWSLSPSEPPQSLDRDIPTDAAIDPSDITTLAVPVPGGVCLRTSGQIDRCFDLPAKQ